MPYAWPLVFLFYGPFAEVLLWFTSRIVVNNYFILCEFITLLDFHRGLSDCKSLQVSKTLLSILVDLNQNLLDSFFWFPTVPRVFPNFEDCYNHRNAIGITTTTDMFQFFFVRWLGQIIYLYFQYFTPYKFFTSAFPDGLSLGFEWQQVSRTLRGIL